MMSWPTYDIMRTRGSRAFGTLRRPVFGGLFTISPNSETISSRLSAAFVPKQVRDNTESLHSDRQCQMPVILLEPSMNTVALISAIQAVQLHENKYRKAVQLSLFFIFLFCYTWKFFTRLLFPPLLPCCIYSHAVVLPVLHWWGPLYSDQNVWYQLKSGYYLVGARAKEISQLLFLL